MFRHLILAALLLCARLSAEVSAFNGVPITSASNVMGVSPLAAVLGQPVVAGGLSPTFAWDFEAATPNVGTYDQLDFDFDAALSTEQAVSGTQSLKIATTTFSQVQVFNDTNSDVWAPVAEGGIIIRWYYTGTWTNADMIFQIDGKSNNGALDTNDALDIKTTSTTGRLAISWRGNNGASVTTLNATFESLTTGWHTIRVDYKQSGPRRLAVKLNDQPVVYTASALTATTCVAWHHMSIGKDVSTASTYYLDDLAVYPIFVDQTTYASTYLIAEECEGTGTPSGWTDAGSPNWDNTTTSPKGSQSLALTSAAMSTYYSISAASEVWVRVAFRTSAIANTPNILTLQDSSGNQILRFAAQSNGAIRIYNESNATLVTSAGSLIANDTLMWLWVHYKAGSGSNAIAEAYLSTDPATRPGTPNTSSFASTNTASVGRLRFVGVNSTTTIIDNILLATAEIGDGAKP